MAKLVAEYDWATTPLGPIESWQQSLKTAVDIILASGQAMQLAWGPRHTLIYNDAYAPMLGDRHPSALGRPFDEVWSDAWPQIEGFVTSVFQGETIQFQDMPLTLTRHGYPEETWWTFSYSPIRDEAGAVAGLLNVPIDTTSRVRADQAEHALRQNEWRLTSVLDGMDQAFGLLDPDFRIVTQNRAALQLDGRPLSEIRGLTHWEAYPGTEESELGRIYKRAMAEQVPISLEHRYDWPDGTQSWLEMHAAPVTEGLAVFWRDISERKAVESALRHSEERQGFLLQLGDALRPFSEVAGARAQGCEHLGKRLDAARVYVVEYVAGKDRGEVSDDYHAADLPSLAGDYPFETLRNGGEDIATAWVMPDVTQDSGLSNPELKRHVGMGLMSWVNVPLLKAGRTEAVLCVADSKPRNWSHEEIRLIEQAAERIWASIQRNQAEQALRESELRFQQFGASSLAAIWIRNATTFDFEYMNAAVEPVFGVTPQQLAEDKNAILALILQEDRDAMSDRVSRIAGGETLISEYRIRHARSKTYRWIRSIGFPIRDAQGKVKRIGGIAEDVTETKLALEHQQLLLSELQHRVRNLMAVIRTIALRTEKSVSTPREFREALTGRLTALSRVQTLLTRSGNQAGALREVIEAEILAKAESDAAFTLSGPDIVLSSKAVEVLALAFHELCTNAIKYGALSVPHGHISVDWRTVKRHGLVWLSLDWVEAGKPAQAPARRGFGTELIEGRIPYELGGSGKLTYGPTGLSCHLEFPLKRRDSFLATDAPRPTMVSGEKPDQNPPADLEGQTILVVEDDFYIATDLVATLQEANAMVLGPCMTEAAAILALERTRPDAAVLDVNLGGQGPRFEVARLLRQHGIPFVFVTGYEKENIPPDLREAPHMQKPIDVRHLIRILKSLG